MEKKSKKSGKKILYYVLLGFFTLVFLVSVIYICTYLIRSRKQSGEYDSLASIRESIQQEQATAPSDTLPVNPEGPTEVTQPKETQPPEILPEYQSLYEQNPDMVGWITVPDTKVNYPVMQTPNDRNFYLYRNFQKQDSLWGCIYAREECDILRPSDNITIYGHHMRDGSMFAGLDAYKEESFWKNHRTIHFDTLYERHTYEVLAVFKTSANAGQGFAYHIFEDARNEEEFNQFYEQVKKLQFYETGVTAAYGDKLITLSTCEYTLDNGRFVVVAKRIV